MKKLDPIIRFWAKVDKRGPDECWPWLAACVKDGYGGLKVYGKTVQAHRFSWELAHGCKIPEGKLVQHSCDNPPCCNPKHLFLGTDKTNAMDMVRKDRHGMIKLTSATVIKIRTLYREGKKVSQLSVMFDTPRQTIGGIVTGNRR